MGFKLVRALFPKLVILVGAVPIAPIKQPLKGRRGKVKQRKITQFSTQLTSPVTPSLETTCYLCPNSKPLNGKGQSGKVNHKLFGNNVPIGNQ